MVDPATGGRKPEFERLNLYGTEFHRHPYSGYERNKWFLNIHGRDFSDLSGISGADEIADSRTWVRWDFDRDGRPDIAVVNANKPLLSWFRNATLQAGFRAGNRFLALRFEGAQRSAQAAADGRSNRDGYGARVVIAAGDLTMEREHVCGEGFAGQNSATMLAGIGKATEATVTVHWPGGTVTGPERVPADTAVTCREAGARPLFEVGAYRDAE